MVFVNLNSLLLTWNRQVQLIVYLKDNISKPDRKNLEKLIASNPDVEASDFVSREMAWENFKNTFSGKSEIMESLEFNPLPASMNLKFKPASNRLKNIREFSELLQTQEGVESLEYGEKWISRFETFMAFTRLFLLAVGGLLSLGLILIISNTIKLSIYSRKDEIELMVMIGARPQFIKVPFLLEGMTQGLAGAVISIGIIKSIHLYMKWQFEGTIESFLRGMDIQFISFPLILALVFTSMLVGWMGSLISINQFLTSEGKK